MHMEHSDFIKGAGIMNGGPYWSNLWNGADPESDVVTRVSYPKIMELFDNGEIADPSNL